MHLDTVLTMIDYDKFTVHRIFKEENNMNIFTIEQNDGKDDIKLLVLASYVKHLLKF